MKIEANNIRTGNVLDYNNKLWVVTKTMHTQPGKGGAYMQVEMKDMLQGTKMNVRFRSSETVERAHLDQKQYQYIFSDGNLLTLMDQDTYEQIEVNKELVGGQEPFLQEGVIVTAESYNGNIISLSLPETMEFEIAECEPVVKGQTAASSYKPAVLANGVRIMVPPFINQGDKIVLKVENKEYLERAK